MVLALRVVPMSANGFEAGLLLYDVCRPFSMLVAGTTVSDWRWVGLPETVDLSSAVVKVWRQDLEVDFDTLQGEHPPIPSVMPDAIHCDNAAIFTSVHFRALLRDLQIDLLLSRPGNPPTDNPQVERWHETIQRGLQQIPGYKGGRNVSERGGRLVADEPLLTARELQLHLRKFIALDYHRHGHDGLIQPGVEAAKMCPLDLWDVMVEATGRIDVPPAARPDLPVPTDQVGHHRTSGSRILQPPIRKPACLRAVALRRGGPISRKGPGRTVLLRSKRSVAHMVS